MQNTGYKHVFFDLDRTIYDFDTNNRETLFDLFHKFEIGSKEGLGFDHFFDVYSKINFSLWEQYKKRQISKEFLNRTRFKRTLNAIGVAGVNPSVLASEYIVLSPTKKNLMPGAMETLQYLKPRYHLHLITNGFSEIQFFKIRNCGLQNFFEHVIVSEEAGAQKPDPAIFNFAFEKTGAMPDESLIVGDDPDSDINGGKNAGMDQVWLSLPGESTSVAPTYEISNLLQLKQIL